MAINPEIYRQAYDRVQTRGKESESSFGKDVARAYRDIAMGSMFGCTNDSYYRASRSIDGDSKNLERIANAEHASRTR